MSRVLLRWADGGCVPTYDYFASILLIGNIANLNDIDATT